MFMWMRLASQFFVGGAIKKIPLLNPINLMSVIMTNVSNSLIIASNSSVDAK